MSLQAGDFTHLEAIAHRYMTRCQVDEKARHKQWRNLSVTLASISTRPFSHFGIAYAFVKSYRGIVCIVEATDTRSYVDTLHWSIPHKNNCTVDQLYSRGLPLDLGPIQHLSVPLLMPP